MSKGAGGRLKKIFTSYKKVLMQSVPLVMVINPAALNRSESGRLPQSQAAKTGTRQAGTWVSDGSGRKFLHPLWLSAAVQVCVKCLEPGACEQRHRLWQQPCPFNSARSGNQGRLVTLQQGLVFPAALGGPGRFAAEPAPCRPKRHPVFGVQSLE